MNSRVTARPTPESAAAGRAPTGQRADLDVDVCVCTHAPRRDVLDRVLVALARQETADLRVRVTIIDNASEPPLDATVLHPLVQAGVAARLVREPHLGNAYARARAIRESTAPVLLFVDDDNELCGDYVARAAGVLRDDPSLGCLGGKLLRAGNVRFPAWLEPLRGYLGIHDDYGEAPLTAEVGQSWSRAEPPSAGMAIRREVALLYLQYERAFDRLGRRGRARLGSLEDGLMTRQAQRLGLKCSYRPELFLFHHLDPTRLRLPYMLRLMWGQGRSEVELHRILGYRDDRGTVARLQDATASVRSWLGVRPDARVLLCWAAWNAGVVATRLESFGRR